MNAPSAPLFSSICNQASPLRHFTMTIESFYGTFCSARLFIASLSNSHRRHKVLRKISWLSWKMELAGECVPHIIIIIVHQTNDYYFIHLMLSQSQNVSDSKRNEKIIYFFMIIMSQKTHTHTHTEGKPTNPHKSNKIVMDIQCWRRRFVCKSGKEIESMPATANRNNRVATSLKTNTIHFECFTLTWINDSMLNGTKPIDAAIL